ncbi:MAG: hypothetical protein RI568_07400 [Natronomonas sp.]|nr:hypothetical protein [Natronomonas sp.]MDR9430513.1 hypothetical protein [Natronomonas sp.]
MPGADALEGGAGGEDAFIVEAVADELEANRQTAVGRARGFPAVVPERA